jgi:transcriptional regulator GlxA family with amidase domain
MLMDAMSRRAFAEQLALAVAAPWLIEDFPKAPTPSSQPQQEEPSALAKALAETVRLRYPDRFTAEDLITITRSIDMRLRQIERLYETTLTNADEPDFVYSVYRGAD